MDDTGCPQQLELFEVNRQQVTVTFDGEQIVSDAGLLPIRQLDQQLGVLAESDPELKTERLHTQGFCLLTTGGGA